MTTPAKDGAAESVAEASSIALWSRVRTRDGISDAVASSIAVAEGMPRVPGSLTESEPDQLLDAYADFVLYGVFDGSFAAGPEVGPGVDLDPNDPTKQMEYWSGPTQISGSAGTLRQITDSQYPSGYGLRFDFAASATADEIEIEQTIPLAGSYFRVVGGVLRISGVRIAGTGLSSRITLEYMGADGTVYDTDVQTQSVAALLHHHSDRGSLIPDGRVRKVRIRLAILRSLGAAGTPATVDLSDVRFDRTTLYQTFADDQGTFAPWRIWNSSGSLQWHYDDGSGDNTWFAIEADAAASPILGYPSLWTLLPLGLAMQSAPATPDSGWFAIYPKTDGKLYGKNDSGVETALTNDTLDADLTAIGAVTGTGILARTAANTWALRTLAAPAAGITITNPGGVSDAPTLALADDAAALEALTGTGFAYRTGTSTWAIYALPDVQTFSGSGAGTWTKPTGATVVYALVVGPGGGGGSGRRGAAGSSRPGGGGGGGGAVNEMWFLAASFGSTAAVTAPAGGAGGAAVTTNDTPGNAGTAGATANFGSLKASGGGGGGGGATGVPGVAGTGGSVFGVFAGSDGAAGTTNTTPSKPTGGAGPIWWGGAGGGGAAGINTSDVSGNGGDGGDGNKYSVAGGAGSTTGGGVAPGAGTQFGLWAGSGGGGGCNGTNARPGADGGRGSGGGGSSGTLNGTNSPAAGDGGPGYVAVVSY